MIRQKLIFLFLLLLVGVSPMKSFAAPRPDMEFCAEQGYEIEEGDYCVFPDGNKCELYAFYQGKCGRKYRKNISCKKAGDSPGYFGKCCWGLEEIEYHTGPDADGNCGLPLMGRSSGICSNCGNGVCEEWENKCNCPEDCDPDSPLAKTYINPIWAKILPVVIGFLLVLLFFYNKRKRKS